MKVVKYAVLAAVALYALANPSLTASVLAPAQSAVTGIRAEVAREFTGLRPAPADGAAPTVGQPVRPSVDSSADPGSYRFVETDKGGRPVSWSRCAVVPIVVNVANAPDGVLEELKQAVGRIDEASGLQLQIVGTSTATPRANWGEKAEAGFPGRAPVLVAFGPSGTANLSGGAAGETTVRASGPSGHLVLTSGVIVFNSSTLPGFTPGFGTGTSRGTVFLHELGHLAGLDHVTTRSQIMYPQMGGASDLGAGDRAGLKILGSQPCN